MIRSGREAFPEKFTSPRATLVKQRASGEYRRFLLVRREPIFRNTRPVSNSLSPIELALPPYRILRFPIAAENRENAREQDVSRENVKHLFLTCRRFPFLFFHLFLPFLLFFFISQLVWRTQMDNFHRSSASSKARQ